MSPAGFAARVVGATWTVLSAAVGYLATMTFLPETGLAAPLWGAFMVACASLPLLGIALVAGAGAWVWAAAQAHRRAAFRAATTEAAR